MMFCKEVIVTPNDDNTYKLEFVSCKLMDNGKEVEANIVFPRASKDQADSVSNSGTNLYDFAKFNSLPSNEESEIFTICIPE